MTGFGGFSERLESVASAVDRDDLGVMEQAVEDGAGGRHIAEQLAPFFDGSVGGHHGGTVFVAAHDDLQEDFAAFWRKDFEPHVINDQQIGLKVFIEQTSLTG